MQVRRSNATRIHLNKIDWFTKGNYRCEVTAEDFETADEFISTDVVGKSYYLHYSHWINIRLLYQNLIGLWSKSLLISFLAAVPKRNPYITGQKSRYSVGEVVDLNCTSNASIPEAELSWYVNSVEVSYSQTLLRRSEKVKRTLSDSIFRPTLMHFAAFFIRANLPFDLDWECRTAFVMGAKLFGQL